MELAIKVTSNGKTVRTDNIQVLKEFNSQSLTTLAKVSEQLVSMMPDIKKAFNLMGDDIIELSTENEALKNQMGEFNERWLQESKANFLKEINDAKRANLIMSRKKKQMEKNQINGVYILY